jgi:hypothetical protein
LRAIAEDFLRFAGVHCQRESVDLEDLAVDDLTCRNPGWPGSRGDEHSWLICGNHPLGKARYGRRLFEKVVVVYDEPSFRRPRSKVADH